MSKINNMDAGDWIWLLSTALIQALAVGAAVGSWSEFKTPAVAIGAVIAFLIPFATYFKQGPEK